MSAKNSNLLISSDRKKITIKPITKKTKKASTDVLIEKVTKKYSKVLRKLASM